MSHNIRYALRLLGRNPGFTAAAIACLTLGIGATTAIFSVVNAVVLRPLPYRDSGKLVRIFTEFPNFPNGGLRHFWVSPPEFLDMRRDLSSWEAIEGWVNQGANIAGATEPVRTTVSFVSGGMLSMLGVQPVLGRVFSAADDQPNVVLTAVLSHGLWQRAFGGERSIIGRDIRLNGNPCHVIGVMPADFAFPPGELDPPEVWLPLQIDPPRPGGRGSHFLSLIGRLKPNVTLARADGEIARYVQHTGETSAQGTHPFHPKNHPIVTAGFQDEVVQGVKPAMLVLLGAVGFVLLIACVNVANLLLARSESRRREIAVRAAIGAGLGRLLQQFIVEGILLSLGGAALGLLLAFGGLRLIVATNAGSIPRVAEVGIDWQVLLFALGVSVATGVIFGLAPIVHTRPSTLHDTLKSASGRSAGSQQANRFRALLVTSELALALVLLIGSGLMVKAFWRLMDVNAGFDPSRVLTMRLALPSATYPNPAAVSGFYNNLLERVQSLPGVEAASAVSGLPPGRPINANDTMIEGFVPRPGGPIQNFDYYNSVSPRYFEAMRARLVEGRLFTDGDGASANPVVLVNQTLARTYWPDGSALGHRVRNGGPSAPWRTIVGVVADVKNAALDRPAGTELYFPAAQAPRNTSYLAIRTKGDPMSLASAVRAQIAAIDRSLPISDLRTMEDVMDRARSRPRFLTLLLTLFSSIALALAALGIYGVISFSVAQRTNEIGIRMALGAQGGDVLKLIGAAGLRLAVAGTVVGAIGAFALTRTMSGLLFGVSSFDPLTFILMAGALIGVTLLACYLPARRAARVDPLVALRYE